ncbi:MAG TPA: helix-turn-helix transcriptional regulator [Longimicrobiales bacterium]|nr:helix-turn-helix transcriptional regulator [Longimicrobiales bacterium]
MSEPDPSLPLRPPVFHILLALSTEPRHGLGIADEAESASQGVVRLGPGTLYRSLDEMAGDGLVEPVPPPDPEADPRRKYYGITGAGRRLLQAEVSRLERLTRHARARLAGDEVAG